MISEGTRRFDLYDFFSVFLPGAVAVIGIAPFLPHDTEIASVGAIGIVVVTGFILGRALHAVGLLFEAPVKESKPLSIGGYDIHGFDVTTSHREYFIIQLQKADEISEDLVTEFYNSVTDTYSNLKIPDDRKDLKKGHEEELETVYTLVRSQIHMDGRGRSRTFQAILDFQRTMVFTSLMLFVIYVVYGFSLFFEAGPVIGYQTYISSLEPAWWLIITLSIAALISTYLIFERVRSSYRRYFIQYLMADFVTLYTSANGNSS